MSDTQLFSTFAAWLGVWPLDHDPHFNTPPSRCCYLTAINSWPQAVSGFVFCFLCGSLGTGLSLPQKFQPPQGSLRISDPPAPPDSPQPTLVLSLSNTTFRHLRIPFFYTQKAVRQREKHFFGLFCLTSPDRFWAP